MLLGWFRYVAGMFFGMFQGYFTDALDSFQMILSYLKASIKNVKNSYSGIISICLSGRKDQDCVPHVLSIFSSKHYLRNNMFCSFIDCDSIYFVYFRHFIHSIYFSYIYIHIFIYRERARERDREILYISYIYIGTEITTSCSWRILRLLGRSSSMLTALAMHAKVWR